MELAVTSSGGSANSSADVGDLGLLVTLVFEHGTNTGLEEGPATCVLLFLLAPNDFSVLILGKFGTEGVEWEGSKLLNSDNCNIINLILLSLSNKIVVDLTGTANDLFTVFWFNFDILLWQHSLELSAFSEFAHITLDFSHLKHLLRCNNN